MNKKATITFHGGVDTVTGANFLVEAEGKKILVDCGMFQGTDETEERNFDDFPYNPTEIDILLVTHAHTDHIGRVPVLVKHGFRGKIYSTKPTMELAPVMFADGYEIVKREAEKKGKEPIYSESDYERALSLWHPISYHNTLEITPNISVVPYDAGHIIGSAMYKFSFGDTTVLFSGDLGNSPDILLPDTEVVTDVDYLVVESVYGDRVHDDRSDRLVELERIIERVVQEKGVLIIPSFALERTQALLYSLNTLVEEGRVSPIPVYFDSPLAIDITEVFKKNTDVLNAAVQERLKTDRDVFSFPRLTTTYSREESQAIFRQPNPKIILASAGMSHAGRVIFHEKFYLDEPETTLLFVGYQAVGTLGRMIQDGVKKVNILGKDIEIRAKIETIESYSAHRDMNGLLSFVEGMKDSLKKVFCVMGERKSSFFLVQRIRDYFGIDARSPEIGESFEIEY